ncbi:MAG: tetratricopeptide repeat protein [Anaerolineales bacterium]|nr:MAG: tetratricopeptide repeat protein [Anaerolineales bacterium]
MSIIRIQALGPFHIWRDGKAVPDEAWPTYKSKQLFKILLTERGHLVSADRLIEYLWPDLSLKQAKNNLWVTVSQVRHVLQPGLPRRTPSDYILTQHDGYVFSTESDYWLDVEAFTDQLKAVQQSEPGLAQIKVLETTRQIYCGDYLEEDPYEEWALATREQLRNLYLGLLTDLAEAYARQGRYRRAISLCLESLAMDNLREAVYRQLMLYHYYAGEQNLALKVYDECCEIMQDELGVEPMLETSSLRQQIEERRVKVVPAEVQYPPPVQDLVSSYTLGRAPFVGRDQEYHRLAGFVKDTAAGQGRVALIEGEPGIGKSRLIQEVAGLAQNQGFSLLFAHCYFVERDMPYQPIIDVVRQVVEEWPTEMWRRLPTVWLAEIARLVPEIAEIIPNLPTVLAEVDKGRQGRLFQALVQLFTTIADENKLMLAIDDLHWADPATLQFLHHLARHIFDSPIFLACTYRSEEAATDEDLAILVRSLKREPHVWQMRLLRLSDDDVQTVIETMVALSSPQAMGLGQWLYRETDGNPFFLVSILQSLLEQGLLSVDDEFEWPIDPQELYTARIDLTLPDALREAVRERLQRVPKKLQRGLELAAVLGRHFVFATLQGLVEESQTDLLDAIEALRARQLFIEEADGIHYDFYHDKIREVIYHDLSGPRRMLMHKAVAELLESQAGNRLAETAATLAHHFERAGEPSRALSYWLQAGAHALSTYTARQAVRHYERALALAEQQAERIDAYLGLGWAYFALDDSKAATTVLNQGLNLAKGLNDDRRRARLLFALAKVCFGHYDTDTSESYAQSALAAAETIGDSETVIESSLLLTEINETQGDLNAAIQGITRALDTCRHLDNHWLEGRALTAMGVLRAQRGEFAAAADSALQALHILENTNDQASMVYAWNILGRAEGGRGAYEAAFAAFTRSLELAKTVDDKTFIAQTPNMLGWLHQQLCNYERAQVFDQESLELARRWGKTPVEISALINLVLDTLHLGDPERALADLEIIQTRITHEAIGFHAWRWRLRLLHTRGLCRLALAEPEEALGLAEEGLALARIAAARKYVALNHELKGAALADLGKTVEAMAELETAVSLADTIHYQPLRWAGRYQLAKLYRQSNREQEARAARWEAGNIIQAIAAQLTDESLRAAFLNAEQVCAIFPPIPPDSPLAQYAT